MQWTLFKELFSILPGTLVPLIFWHVNFNDIGLLGD